MSASVLLSCGLSEKFLVPSVFIGESSGVDGTFLISCLLGHQFKHRNTGVLLVCLHHTFDHYIEAGLKLGYSLAGASERKSLVVHDFLRSVPELTANGVNLVEKCLQDIVSDLELLGQGKEHTTIILDDVSVFLNLGVSENVLLNFCRELQKFTAWHPRVTLITKINCAEIHGILCNYLYDFANIRLSVKPLESGKFQDVDGKIIINHKNEDIQNGEKDKVILYRVNERNIKIFLPGEYSVSG
uniref:Elongator complex protein 6 n=1 Tax=Phlebotomus kandelakii TaxID=1109342 RepID=A0A6B2E829_9DIPT